MIGIAWLVCLVAWPMVALIPDKYETSARIVVDTESLLRPLLRGLTVETNSLQQIEIMHRTLLSRPNLEKVVRMTDLDINLRTEAELEEMIKGLQDDVQVSAQRANLFKISYTNSVPEVSYKIVQALISIFVEGNLGDSRKNLDSARQFIEEQVRIYEEQMRAAEERLSRFKQANLGLLPGSTSYYDFLTQSRGDLAVLEAELADTIARENEIRRQLAGVPEYMEVDQDFEAGGPPSGVEVRILELQHRLDELLLNFTPSHPDVKSTQRLLTDLQEELAGPPVDEETLEEPQSTTNRVPNELYQSIKLQLVSAQTEVATLRSKVERKRRKNIELEEQANRIPEIESELVRLNRDYELSRSKYEALVSRKDAAIMAESQETKAEKVQFRIVEPPKMPVLPTGIKRSLILSAVVVLAFGAGLGLVVLLVSMQTTFSSAFRLAQVTGLPVLGIISQGESKTRKSFRTVRLMAFIFAVWLLIAVYIALVMVERNVGLTNAVPTTFKERVIEVLPERFRSFVK